MGGFAAPGTGYPERPVPGNVGGIEVPPPGGVGRRRRRGGLGRGAGSRTVEEPGGISTYVRGLDEGGPGPGESTGAGGGLLERLVKRRMDAWEKQQADEAKMRGLDISEREEGIRARNAPKMESGERGFEGLARQAALREALIRSKAGAAAAQGEYATNVGAAGAFRPPPMSASQQASLPLMERYAGLPNYMRGAAAFAGSQRGVR